MADEEAHIQRLNHLMVTIPVGAEDDGRRFYCGVLGLPELPKPDSLLSRGGFWVQLGDLQLHIGVEDGIARQATKAHLAYQVVDLAAWRQRLEAAGCVMLESIPIPGYDRFETRDPFGNRLEFIHPLPR
jgi:catechol 2,3-dioxygenase-like lactoylglutathione lyase family enzyme